MQAASATITMNWKRLNEASKSNIDEIIGKQSRFAEQRFLFLSKAYSIDIFFRDISMLLDLVAMIILFIQIENSEASFLFSICWNITNQRAHSNMQLNRQYDITIVCLQEFTIQSHRIAPRTPDVDDVSDC